MAKSSKPAAAKKTPAKKSEKSSTPAGEGSPSLNTSLAAETAARLLVAKVPSKTQASGSAPKESSTFKQLKSGMGAGGNAMSNMLDKTGGPVGGGGHQKFGHGQKQVGHNQTFGADVNRAGVPRRTGGG